MTSMDIEGLKLVDLEEVAQVERLKQFLQEQGVEKPEFMTSGHMNLSWQGEFQGREVVCQFGPNLSTYQLSLSEIKSYGYFNPGKYEKAQLICQATLEAGIPCPSILKAGYAGTLSRSWCIAEKAEGEDLDKIWKQLPRSTKLSLGHQIGGKIANIHSINPDVYGQNPISPQAWYRGWFKQVFANLSALGIYQPQELEKIKESIVPQFLAENMPPFLTTIHGDILQKNIFVKKDPKEYKVSSIIDWETAGLGNPWADVILAAWWISDEYGGDNKLYEAVIGGYNEVISGGALALSLNRSRTMRPYIDLWWYLNILWVRPLMGDFSQVERRRKMVEKVMEEL